VPMILAMGAFDRGEDLASATFPPRIPEPAAWRQEPRGADDSKTSAQADLMA